jgi:two-component system, OmpR family, KDP operon response regulator KdpE
MNTNELILIVEDDEAISKLLTISLFEYGYKTRYANTLALAKREYISHNPMLIILDLGLPDGDGKKLIQEVRKASKMPIIVLSARSEEKEIIAALDLGADDYVTKPFSTSELLARVRSTLRRVHHEISHEILTCKDITIDFTKKEVTLKGSLLKLTPTEYNLLRYLMQNANKVLPHRHILKEVWGVGYQNEMQYLRTYINSLRKKIEKSSTRPEYITTESSIGYRFSCNDVKGNE